MRRNLFLLVLGAIIIGGTGGLVLVHKNKQLTAAPSATVAADVPAVRTTPTDGSISYTGVDGKNALDLLKKDHTVSEQTSSYGSFVQGIDGKMGDDKHYWAFYVNGTLASVGAGSYTTKNTDSIQWKFDEIK